MGGRGSDGAALQPSDPRGGGPEDEPPAFPASTSSQESSTHGPRGLRTTTSTTSSRGKPGPGRHEQVSYCQVTSMKLPS